MQNNSSYQTPLSDIFSPDPRCENPNDSVYSTANPERLIPLESKGLHVPFVTRLSSRPDLHHLENRRRRQLAALRPNPYRRFSWRWFLFGWNRAVEVSSKWPRITYILVGVGIVGAWLGVTLAFANEEVKFERSNLNGRYPRTGSSRLTHEIMVKGTLRQFDPITRSLTVSWSLQYVDSDNTTLLDFGTNTNNTYHLNLYRDVKAVPEDRTPSTPYNVSKEYRVDDITVAPIAVLGTHPWDSVLTQIDFVQAVPNNPWKEPLFGFPFDLWSGSIVFALTDRDLALSIGLNNSGIIPLSDALLTDSTFNWRITTANVNNTCLLPQAADGCELHIDFVGRRPGLVIFATMIGVIVNWTTTLGIFLITCEAVVMKRTYILKETDILGVCLTALFALPSIRAILPGSPEFGAIDLVGIIPNIIVISLCTTAFAISKLRAHRTVEERGY